MENIFRTPIFWHVIKDCAALNADLREVILVRERSAVQPAKGNMGGWQSGTDLFTWEEFRDCKALALTGLRSTPLHYSAGDCSGVLPGQYDLFGCGRDQS